MNSSGIFIAVEGIDGSGKRTQVELLTEALNERGHSVYSLGFPQYSSWFGKMVGQFLNGDLGPLDSVDAHFSAMLYAGDRFETKPKLEAALAEGKIVIADRYVGSNLAHQVSRVAPEKRAEFTQWIRHLEYNIYGLPKENLVLYLRVPPVQAQHLVNRKSERSYTTAKQDILESNLRHLEETSQIYDSLSKESPWVRIDCFNAERNAMRRPNDIAKDVLTAVESVLPTVPAKGSR